MSNSDEIRYEGKGYTLACLSPGAHSIVPDPAHHLLDIHIGGGEASYELSPPIEAPSALIPNAFNYVPAGLVERIDTQRSGVSVLFCFEPDAIDVSETREVLRKQIRPLWNQVDIAMLGAAEIVLDYLRAVDVTADTIQTPFLRDLLSIRLGQIILKTSITRPGAQAAGIQRAIEFIEQNLAESLPLEQVAGVAGSSTFHFARQFRAAMNMSVRRYIILRRVETAQKMIAETDVSLAEIAYSTGFSSQSHMTSVFRRFAGRTPATFRKQTSSSIDVTSSG